MIIVGWWFELAGQLLVLRTLPARVPGPHRLAQRELRRVRPDAPRAALSAGSAAVVFGGV
ncbi:MAG: hypothetical protein ABJA86_07590 [Nocardioidaceae bacterium]